MGEGLEPAAFLQTRLNLPRGAGIQGKSSMLLSQRSACPVPSAPPVFLDETTGLGDISTCEQCLRAGTPWRRLDGGGELLRDIHGRHELKLMTAAALARGRILETPLLQDLQ